MRKSACCCAPRFTLAEIKSLLQMHDSRRPPRRVVQALTVAKVEALRVQLRNCATCTTNSCSC